jgi:hypothetical protein
LKASRKGSFSSSSIAILLKNGCYPEYNPLTRLVHRDFS